MGWNGSGQPLVIIRHKCPHCNQELFVEDHARAVVGTSRDQLREFAFDVITQLTDTTKDQILNCTRKREVSFARHMVAKVLHKDLHWSSTEVGGIINRDHTTVLSSCRRLKDLCDTEPDTKATVEYVRKKVLEHKKRLMGIIL